MKLRICSARRNAGRIVPLWVLAVVAIASQAATGQSPESFDVLLRGGTVYDGSGAPGVAADVGIRGQKIAAVGDLGGARGRREVDCRGLAVAPGFINMLSWATDSLLHDGRSQSDIRQGVTLEVFGEGVSYGPLNAAMRQDMQANQGDIRFDVAWTTLSQYLEHLVKRGVSCNVASFVGATTVRIHVLGYENRPPTPAELETMKALVRQEMERGALGLGSSLIYAPAFYARTEELVELARVAAEFDGMYISHLRSEGNRLLEAADELIGIARQANIRAEIYHLKAAGENNWPKLDQLIAKIEAARAEGLAIGADMYPYTAGATGLDAAMPPWVQEGGLSRWIERLRDPATRVKVLSEMRTPSNEWENLLLAAGSPENVLVVGFKNPRLKKYTGKTLAEVGRQRGTSPEEAAMDLVIEDGSRVGTVYFFMDEPSIAKKLRLPWMSIGSDAGSLAPVGEFLKSQPHPRAYGSFARVLGKYVRDEGALPLEQAIHKMTGLPAANLRLDRRGFLRPDYQADVAVFDPATIQDHATYDRPHQYATGMKHVFVNGKQVLEDGEHTGAKPGQAVRREGKTPAGRPAK